MIFNYKGDDGPRIVAWFRVHMHSISICLQNDLPEATLALIYSGIDTFGLLNAAVGIDYTTRRTFMQWCDTYILPRLQTVEGDPLTADDLYAARCGVLHTSAPASSWGRNGKAREIWYQFRGRAGVRLIASLPRPPITLDIEKLALALEEGGLEFCRNLNNDARRHQLADDRAQAFLRWGTVEQPS